jgi:hypothetical protein
VVPGHRERCALRPRRHPDWEKDADDFRYIGELPNDSWVDHVDAAHHNVGASPGLCVRDKEICGDWPQAADSRSKSVF